MTQSVTFNFEINQAVTIETSGETGNVVARSQHRNSEDQFLVEYKNAQGVAVSQWWGQSSLIHAN